MALALQICLIVASVLMLVFITSRVRDAKVKLEDSIFWFCFAFLLLIVSIFPQIFYFFSHLSGTDAPVHFVFLFFIFILIVLGFNQSVRISQMDTKIKELTQQLAIEKFERYCNDNGRDLRVGSAGVVLPDSSGAPSSHASSATQVSPTSPTSSASPNEEKTDPDHPDA